MLVAGVISMAYMFSNAKREQKIAFFMFMISFSPIFKLQADQTSLFMFLRIAIILTFAFQRKEKFGFTFITLLITFFAYSLIVSEIYKSDYIVRLINLVIWIMTGYIIFNSIPANGTTPVARSLSNGVILTGILGLFLEQIPQLNQEIKILSMLAEDGASVSRFAALWVDPNFYTVVLISSMWFTYFEFNQNKLNIYEFAARSILMSLLATMTMSKSCILLLLVFWLYVIIAKNSIKTAPKVGLTFLIFIVAIIFLWRNPYWISDVLYRFVGNSQKINANTLTTGRTGIWEVYISSFLDDFSWLFGHGIGAELLRIGGFGKASHNTLIQLIYNVGIFGTIIYISLYVNMYYSLKRNFNIVNMRTKSPQKYALLSLLATLTFLDAMYIEMYYYMIPLALVYVLYSSGSANMQESEQTDEYSI